MAVVGKLTFETELDIKQLEKDIKGAEKALEQFDNKNDKLNKQKIQLKVDTEDSLKKIDELNTRLEFLRKKSNIIEQQIAGAKTPLAKQQFELQLDKNITEQDQILVKQESINEQIQKNAQLYDEINDKLAYNEKAQEHIKDNISTMKGQLTQAVQEQSALKEKTEETAKASSKSFSGFDGVIKKITKIGLGLVGLRTGMALLRSSISTVASQNDKIATKINSIKSAIANALTPVVQFVVNLFARLVAYIGYIIKAWTGRDIFKNSAKSTNKMKNNIGGANKEVSKLKRTLAGFDEMNILQKDGGVSSGGGGGGVSDVDMSIFKDIEIPRWIKWIADNKDSIIGQLKEIAKWLLIAFSVVELLKFMKIVDLLRTGLGKLIPSIEKLSSLQMVGVIAGIALTIKGLIDTIKGIIGLIKDPSWNNWSKTLGGLSTTLMGVGIALISINKASPVGWILTAIGVILKLVKSFKDEEEQLKDTKKAQDNLRESTEAYNRSVNEYLRALEGLEEQEQNLIEVGEKYGLSQDEVLAKGEELYKQVQDGTLKLRDLKGENLELIKATVNYKQAQDDIIKTEKTMHEANEQQLSDQTKVAYSIAANTDNWDEYKQKVLQFYKVTGDVEGVSIMFISALNEMDKESRQTFVDDLPNDVKQGISKMSGFIKGPLPNLTIKTTLDTTKANQTLEALKKRLPKTFKLMGFAKGGIINLPKLAPGGLINRPGPGVAIGGERGTEGVVPLTDSQQMARLGEAIGRYVNIRAEIPVSVGNRQIAREIRNINADESFAFNG